MRQVHYSTQNSNSIDLVFFVNGIPVATAELKTDFTQNITDAVLQYKHHRLPKGEPLLAFGSRALVHFAVSNSEVQMTTKLAGKDTRLPAVQPGQQPSRREPAQPARLTDGLPVAARSCSATPGWTSSDASCTCRSPTRSIRSSDKKIRTQTMLFPRFHQWEAVTRLVEAARAQGPGHRYLIQHSAGSGKTNSISWLAHRLSVLHDEANKPVFDSVIVITDRNVLDAQLQEAIRQIDRTPGVVAHIAGLGGAKSQELADALQGGTKIIIVTIQTFPYALELIRTQADLKGKTFAIIADEAHSSQAGEASKRLKAALTATELDELADGGTVDAEDVLAAEMAARAESKNLSFFAFTATPKAKTLELFGHKGHRRAAAPVPPVLDAAGHRGGLHPRRAEATTPRTRPRSGSPTTGRPTRPRTPPTRGPSQVTGGADGELVDKSAAIKSVMNWVKLHPTNISQKVQIIVEHFRDNVGWRLDGKAKAMVVTSSRKAAVRYKLAFDKYIAEKGYTDVAALVAFSGEVTDLESAVEKVTETSTLMNPGLKGRDLRDAFATDEYNVMLVANKFQTGFDQPLLVAMYVDKRLSGVAAVQTLSRLNRIAPGKDQTFVLDFANTAEDIVEAFEPYYEATTLADVTDPNIVHETMAKLDAAGIYLESEVNGLVADFLAHKGNNALTKWVTPARDRFRDRERTALDHNDKLALDELELFRKDVGTFLRQYDFLSQIVNYEDPSLEKLSIYLRHLAPVITSEQLNHEIDLSTVDFDYITQHKQDTTSGKPHRRCAARNRSRSPAPAPPAIRKWWPSTRSSPRSTTCSPVITRIPACATSSPTSKTGSKKARPCSSRRRTTPWPSSRPAPTCTNEFVGAVIGAMDSSTDLSTQILNNPELSQKLLGELVPIIYKELKATA